MIVMQSSEESGAESVSARSSVSPSPTSSNLGRPNKSLVRNYFAYNILSGKSMCRVSTSDSGEVGTLSSSPAVCGKAFAGKFPSTLKQHLKTFHAVRYQQLLKDEEKQKEEKEVQKYKVLKADIGPTKRQKTLREVCQTKYDKESHKYTQDGHFCWKL